MSKQDPRDGSQSSSSSLPPQPAPPYQTFAPGNVNPHVPSMQSQSFSDAYQPSSHRAASMGSSLYQQVSPTTQMPASKVAIPALRAGRAAESAKLAKKGRTSHACDACRKAKAGCSGGQPCTRCRTTRSACVYGDGKRDREKKWV